MSERRKENLQPPTGVERRASPPRRRELSKALGEAVTKYEEERAAREELEREKAVLESERYVDPKTGLGSRRAFDEKFSVLVDIAHTNNEPLAFLFFDANNLHNLNKREGHAAGDKFLASIASKLKAISRDTDMVTRNGGDEFGIVLTGFKPLPGVGDAELVEDTLKRYKETLGSDAAVGIAILRLGESPEELYARADATSTADKPYDQRIGQERLAS